MSGLRMQVREECLAGHLALRRTSDKWSCLLVANLVEGAMHFNALRRSLKGISQWSLTRALRGLERDGMISRMVATSIPPRVDYQLTDLGWQMLAQLRRLGAWAMKHEPAIHQARDRFDAEHVKSPRRPRFSRLTSL